MRAEREHIGDLLGGVLLAAAEDVGLGAFGVADLMDVCLLRASATCPTFSHVGVTLTIVPYVIKPTSAFSGRRLKLMTRDSLRAAKLSSSWHISTTYRKIGGLGAGRESLYSMVVLFGWSSGGIALGVMSL